MTPNTPLDQQVIELIKAQHFPDGLDTGVYLRQVYNIVSALTRAILQDDSVTQQAGGIGPHFIELRQSQYPVYLLLQFVMESSAAARSLPAQDLPGQESPV
jgi:hypothetical protein